jgi:hypothetical protein
VKRSVVLVVFVLLAAMSSRAAVASRADASQVLSRDASFAADHDLFTTSRGGIVAAAARVAARRDLIVRARRGTRVRTSELEAIALADGRRLRLGTLRATVRELLHARHVFGREDLAIEAHHIGIPTLAYAVERFGAETPSYAELYFSSAPDRNPQVWHALESGGTYYWRVLAAKRVMRMYRTDRPDLEYEGYLQSRKSSAEEVMHPRRNTPQFLTPAAIAAAWRHHVLRPIPPDSARTHIVVSRWLGQEARKLGRSRGLYRGLRPAALDVLLYIGDRVHELSRAPRLLLTSAVRDRRYQRVLMRVNANAARTYSLHTTGYAFDIARRYSSGWQAAMFQFVLDRLSAVGAIAYIRESAAIHITVASDARTRLALLRLG